jgi:hypothetical protein
MLTAARRQSDSEGGVGKPLHKQKDERRRGPPALNYVGEIDAEVKEEIRVQPFPVVVNQPCEAEASPT